MLRRPRRNRQSAAIRGMATETHLNAQHLVFPLFVLEGTHVRSEIKSLPGNFRFSPDELLREIEACMQLGITNFVIFPAVADHLKDQVATYSYAADNFYLQTAREIKKRFPECCLISDVAMDPYSSDGHDGLVENGEIVNDKTLPILAKMSVAQAEAGFDMLGPSDMMDGRVGQIRRTLDQNGFNDTAILSYAVKYASCFYGPFRDAVGSSGFLKGDKKTYQMNPANAAEALREVALDIKEGADMVMVKPGLPYLDIIKSVKDTFNVPTFAYQVSGEYAMLRAAAANGWLDYDAALAESLLAFKRAGCDGILSYGAVDYARFLQKP